MRATTASRLWSATLLAAAVPAALLAMLLGVAPGGSGIGHGAAAPTPGAPQPDVEGPFVHRNLAVYLLRGPDRLDLDGVITLAEALEKVLKGFAPDPDPQGDEPGGRVVEADLQKIAASSGQGFELTFFPRLRDELRSRLRQSPQVLRFRGLRRCVFSLTGARRWTHRCRSLEDQILQFLRECLVAESQSASCALLVE